MYKYIIGIFSLLLAWTNADPCFTRLGKSSKCISLSDCAALMSKFSQSPQPRHVTSSQTHCGVDATGPKVCCGPLPSEQTPTNKPVTEEPADPVDENDSYPEPKCGRDTSGNRIFSGTATELDEYPWMALLVYLNTSGVFQYECGGALINRRYIMTAAHCLVRPVEDNDLTLYSVRLGEHDTSTAQDCNEDYCADPPQEIRVQGIYTYPGYKYTNKDKIDDIGLVRLSLRAKYSDFVQPICLISNKSPSYDVGSIAVVAGWGKTLDGHPSPKKLKLNVPIFEKRSCSLKYRQFTTLSDKQLCAGGEFAKDACFGDSGGPLMRILPGDIWEAMGVVSYGRGCGRDGWPAIYTNVASYHDWIEAKMIETNI